jgi:hypothetical protein
MHFAALHMKIQLVNTAELNKAKSAALYVDAACE